MNTNNWKQKRWLLAVHQRKQIKTHNERFLINYGLDKTMCTFSANFAFDKATNGQTYIKHRKCGKHKQSVNAPLNSLFFRWPQLYSVRTSCSSPPRPPPPTPQRQQTKLRGQVKQNSTVSTFLACLYKSSRYETKRTLSERTAAD